MTQLARTEKDARALSRIVQCLFPLRLTKVQMHFLSTISDKMIAGKIQKLISPGIGDSFNVGDAFGSDEIGEDVYFHSDFVEKMLDSEKRKKSVMLDPKFKNRLRKKYLSEDMNVSGLLELTHSNIMTEQMFWVVLYTILTDRCLWEDFFNLELATDVVYSMCFWSNESMRAVSLRYDEEQWQVSLVVELKEADRIAAAKGASYLYFTEN